MPLESFLRLAERPARELQDVHFHQGPQGQPMPCYDGVCTIPHMSSRDVRDAANETRRGRGRFARS